MALVDQYIQTLVLRDSHIDSDDCSSEGVPLKLFVCDLLTPVAWGLRTC
jgi:hypothetical protein